MRLLRGSLDNTQKGANGDVSSSAFAMSNSRSCSVRSVGTPRSVILIGPQPQADRDAHRLPGGYNRCIPENNKPINALIGDAGFRTEGKDASTKT
jgi:hypothetical protein